MAPRAGSDGRSSRRADARVALLVGELRDAEERLQCSELKAASLEQLLEAMQAENAMLQRQRASDRRELSEARERHATPQALKAAPKIADAARALKAQQAVMLAVQERRLKLMDDALTEMNEITFDARTAGRESVAMFSPWRNRPGFLPFFPSDVSVSNVLSLK